MREPEGRSRGGGGGKRTGDRGRGEGSDTLPLPLPIRMATVVVRRLPSDPIRTPAHHPSHRTLVWMQERGGSRSARSLKGKSTTNAEREDRGGRGTGGEFGVGAMAKVDCADAREDEIETSRQPSLAVHLDSVRRHGVLEGSGGSFASGLD